LVARPPARVGSVELRTLPEVWGGGPEVRLRVSACGAGDQQGVVMEA
jgi:hypothetical protein